MFAIDRKMAETRSEENVREHVFKAVKRVNVRRAWPERVSSVEESNLKEGDDAASKHGILEKMSDRNEGTIMICGISRQFLDECPHWVMGEARRAGMMLASQAMWNRG